MSITRRRLVDGPGGRARFHFLVQWRDHYGIEHSRTFADLADATDYDAAVKAGRVAREVPGRAAPVTFGQQAAWWLATKERTKRAGTYALYECELRRHVLPFFAHTPLVAIRRRDVQDWMNTLVVQGLAPATVRHCYRAVFKSVINTAVMDGLLTVSPCFRIEQPEPRPEQFDPLTPAQVQAIAQQAAPRYRALIILGVACGPRFCEAAGLGDIHVLRAARLLRIERQLDRHNSAPTRPRGAPCPYAPGQRCCGAVFAPPKSSAGIRDVPIPELGMDALNQHRERFAPAPCGLLFTTPSGKALNPANWRARVWKPLMRTLPQVPDTTTYHHLRHTYASLLGDAGLSAEKIAARLGHASTRQSEPYVHAYPDPNEGQATRNAIDQAFNTAPAKAPVSPVTTTVTADTASDLRTSARNVDFGD